MYISDVHVPGRSSYVLCGVCYMYSLPGYVYYRVANFVVRNHLWLRTLVKQAFGSWLEAPIACALALCFRHLRLTRYR